MLRKKKNLELVTNLIFHFKTLEKKSKQSLKKAERIIEIRVEISEIEDQKTIEKINKLKISSLKQKN